MLSELRLGFAATAGLMTFFAPCAFPMVPSYVAYYLGDDGGDDRRTVLWRAVTVSVVAALGMFAVYVGLIGVAVAVGSRYLQHLVLVGAVVGLALIGLGVAMLGGVTDGRLLTVQLPERRRSYRGYFAFGAGYAIAAAGCTAPLFISVVLSSLTVGAGAALVTVGAYAGGMATMFLLVTVSLAVGRTALLERATSAGPLLKSVAGVLLIVAGAVQLYLFLFRYGGLAQLGIG